MDTDAAIDPTSPLPRGPHHLSRDEVAASQRTRLLAAFKELLAERGYAALTIGDLAAKASVSRGAFYEHFGSKEDCLMSAYSEFATRLIAAMTAGIGEELAWEEFIAATLSGYLGALEDDRVAARAFIVEMDAAGASARRRRREAVHAFAALLADRHATIRERNPRLGELPESAFIGLAYGVRELVREELEREPGRPLTELSSGILPWATAMIAGAAAAGGEPGSPDKQ